MVWSRRIIISIVRNASIANRWSLTKQRPIQNVDVYSTRGVCSSQKA